MLAQQSAGKLAANTANPQSGRPWRPTRRYENGIAFAVLRHSLTPESSVVLRTSAENSPAARFTWLGLYHNLLSTR